MERLRSVRTVVPLDRHLEGLLLWDTLDLLSHRGVDVAFQTSSYCTWTNTAHTELNQSLESYSGTPTFVEAQSLSPRALYSALEGRVSMI